MRQIRAAVWLILLAVSLTAKADEYSSAVSKAYHMIEAKRPEISHPKHLPELLQHGHRTEYSVVVIHGLYESPYWMHEISQALYDRGFNVLSILLPGHWTRPLEKLDGVRYTDWVQERDRAVEIAHGLGRKVVLAGYSTGGVLSVERALFDRDVAGVMIWAPALQVTNRTAIGSTLGSMLGLSTNEVFDPPADGIDVPYTSSLAGNEVRQLGEILGTPDPKHPISVFSEHRSESDSYLRRRDRYRTLTVPLFVAVTDSDDVISSSEAMDLYRLAQSSPKMLVRYTEADEVSHGMVYRTPKTISFMNRFIDRAFPNR